MKAIRQEDKDTSGKEPEFTFSPKGMHTTSQRLGTIRNLTLGQLSQERRVQVPPHHQIKIQLDESEQRNSDVKGGSPNQRSRQALARTTMRLQQWQWQWQWRYWPAQRAELSR
jgi:hypothetical protein